LVAKRRDRTSEPITNSRLPRQTEERGKPARSSDASFAWPRTKGGDAGTTDRGRLADVDGVEPPGRTAPDRYGIKRRVARIDDINTTADADHGASK